MCIPALKESKHINIFIGLDPFYCLVTECTYKFLRKGTQAKVKTKFQGTTNGTMQLICIRIPGQTLK